MKMKNLALTQVRRGERFTLDGVEFVKLEDDLDAAFAVAADTLPECCQFEDDDAEREDHNNYAGSLLSKTVERWLRGKHPAIFSAVVERPIDLTTMDGMTDYGKPLAVVRALTIDEYRKHRSILPLTSKPYWLATGWTTNSSPYSNGYVAYYISAVGTVDYNRVYQPVIDMLMQRYQIGDGDMGKLSQAIENDDAYWSEAAEEAGMSVEQYKQFQKLQRENEALLRQQRQRQNDQRAQQQLQQWYGEAEQVKGLYPSFDLNAEVKNPQFLSMLRAGVPVQHAYEVVHMDQIKAGVAAMQAKATEKQVVDGIRAKGARPQENGTTSQGAFIVKDDVSKLSKRDRAEIIRRAARGEHIEF